MYYHYHRHGAGLSIKDVLGKELWFEEKMKRRKANEAFIDDASLGRYQ